MKKSLIVTLAALAALTLGMNTTFAKSCDCGCNCPKCECAKKCDCDCCKKGDCKCGEDCKCHQQAQCGCDEKCDCGCKDKKVMKKSNKNIPCECEKAECAE